MWDRPYHAVTKRYEEDVRFTMQLCRWVLKPIGMWPFVYGGSTSPIEKIVSALLITTCSCALCFVLVPSTIYMLLVEPDINVRIKLFGPIFFCLSSTIKYYYLGLRGGAFGKCIQHVKNDWWRVQLDRRHRDIMMKNARIGRNLTILCVLFLYTGGMSYHTVVQLFAKKRIDQNVTIRPLTYPGYDLFFDSQASPAYEIVFCIHCLYALTTYNITTAACSLAAIFVTHACAQIQIAMARLEDLVEGRRSKGTSVKERLAVIVSDHVKVLRFAGQVEKVLREICLMELVASTLIICLLEYYCMTEWKNSDAIALLTYFILLISFTFNMLIFCYIGELLVGQCRKIGVASYEIDWYRLPQKRACDLILLIVISSNPRKLTAGKFFELSLNTFSSVLKSSVVYLNLLRTIAD